ncbi:MAG: DUF4038 domain-containing protein [Cyclobacteriaceae bacterium]|nr:DUF4038 domain-containing protein [Cyclobacteriaceae bacterium]
MKTLLGLLVGALFFLSPVFSQQLKVSENNRHIVYTDGKPFFWLGDTAWELFHRLDREEADLYVQNRAEKGFTVIQAVVLAELDGLNDPNPYGDKPLIDNNPDKPNEAYFKHVDYIVNKANELGIFMGMLPTWGDKFNKKWGVGPVVFTEANAFNYGKFLGNRYKDKKIIWIMGGDRNPENESQLKIVRAMAKGIAEATAKKQLITYHPMGGSNSSQWFHQDEWLDINMYQSGHGEVNNQNYKKTLATYEMTPAKPVLDGEPCYEDHPINWNGQNGWFDAFDSRRAGWWSMLSGACGHTYGNHNIWQMWQPGRQPISAARTPWQQSIDYPGAFEAGYMRAFFENIAWQTLTPATSLVKQGPNTHGMDVLAASSVDGALLVAYSPYGSNFSLDLGKVKSEQLAASWFNPRNNSYVQLPNLQTGAIVQFDPPADPVRGNDWVLMLMAK